MQLDKRLEALAVRQREIGQHHIDRASSETIEASREPIGTFHCKQWLPNFRQHFADQPSIAGVILDQQES